jgi:hypothetical protein
MKKPMEGYFSEICGKKKDFVKNCENYVNSSEFLKKTKISSTV